MNIKRIFLISVIGLSSVALAGCNVKKTANTTGGVDQTSPGAIPANSTVITYGAGGFDASVSAKIGQQVVFKNSSTATVQVDSDPHPTHTLFPELNLGVIEPGQTKSVTFSKAGTYTYHNHLNASQKGTIVVQ